MFFFAFLEVCERCSRSFDFREEGEILGLCELHSDLAEEIRDEETYEWARVWLRYFAAVVPPGFR